MAEQQTMSKEEYVKHEERLKVIERAISQAIHNRPELFEDVSRDVLSSAIHTVATRFRH